jgi:hypothetical protein
MQIVRFVGIVYIHVIMSGSSTNFPSKFNKLVPIFSMNQFPFQSLHEKDKNTQFLDEDQNALIVAEEILSDLPSPFPFRGEMSLPAPQDNRSKRVFIAYPEDHTVIIFAQGLNESDVKFCVQAGHQTKALSYEKNNIYDDCCIVMITCKRDEHWKLDELISVSNGSSSSVPSTAILHSDGLEIRPEPNITRARSP